MKDIETNISNLTEKIEEMRKKSHASTKIASIVYIVLVIFVFAYTSVIMSLVKKKATASNISAQLRLIIDRDLLTEKNRQWVLDTCNEQSPVVAEALVEMTHNQIIPSIEVKLKHLIDTQIDSIIARLEKDVLPELTTVVKDHARDLKGHADDITDEAIAQELAKILTVEFDLEMEKFINDKLKHRIHVFREELDKISSKPYAQLTKKEAAERRLIVNWVFLMEHHESPSNVVGEMLKGINSTYQGFLEDLHLK
jgi:hypothetical protein